jgi:hypothetical protein
VKNSLLCLPLLLAASQASASPGQRLEIPRFDASKTSERAELVHHERTAYAPKGSMPTIERTSTRRLEIDSSTRDGRTRVERARRWAPKPLPRRAGPAAPRAPGAASPKETRTLQRLPCEGKQVQLRRTGPGQVTATIDGEPAKVHPAIGWELRHPLRSLLPPGEVELGGVWSPALAGALPALLGAQAWQRVAHLRVARGSLEAKLVETKESKAVVRLTLSVTFADPPPEPQPLHLEFAASLEAHGTLTLGAKELGLALEGKLVVKRYYTSGAPPDAKIDATTEIHRDLERRAVP